jgi:hypothetical protein
VQPYDGLVTPDGRYYLAGLFGEDGVALLDTWQPEKGTRRILGNYGRGEEKLPVFKMPHLRGWSMAQGKAYLPAVGRHEVLVVSGSDWQEVGRIRSRGSRCSSWRGPMAGRCGSISLFPTTAGSGDRHAERQGGADPRTGQSDSAHGVHAARRAGLDFRP